MPMSPQRAAGFVLLSSAQNGRAAEGVPLDRSNLCSSPINPWLLYPSHQSRGAPNPSKPTIAWLLLTHRFIFFLLGPILIYPCHLLEF